MRVSEGRVGNDYSDDYADKTTRIVFIKGSKQADFKPFIKTFSISRKYNPKYGQKKESFYDEVNWQFDTEQPVYSLSFEIPSNSINEAIVNHSKFQYLMRMVYPPHSDLNENILQEIQMKFGNLISNNTVLGGGGFPAYEKAKNDARNINKIDSITKDYGSMKFSQAYVGRDRYQALEIQGEQFGAQFEAASATELGYDLGFKPSMTFEEEVAFLRSLTDPAGSTPLGQHRPIKNDEPVLVYIKKLTYKPDITMGFFEFSGMIFPKVFSMNLTIEVGSDDMGLAR